MKPIIITVVLALLLFTSVGWCDEIDDLIPCVIEVESGGDPNAISEDGCIGLMQISSIVLLEWNDEQMKKHNIHRDVPKGFLGDDGLGLMWERQFGCERHILEDLFDEYTNTKIGEWYLRRLKDHYLKDQWVASIIDDLGFGYYVLNKNDLKIAMILSAYNGGITRLKKVKYQIDRMPKETQKYVHKVMKLYHEAQ